MVKISNTTKRIYFGIIQLGFRKICKYEIVRPKYEDRANRYLIFCGTVNVTEKLWL